MSVAEWASGVSDWRFALEGLKDFVAPAFQRSEQRASASAFLDGVLSGVERKTGWMLAEEAGLARPYRIQSLLGRSSWSADALRDRVRRYALDALGDPDGVLVIDETGFLKKGAHSVGVAWQYSGTAGRIENSQIGVFDLGLDHCEARSWHGWHRHMSLVMAAAAFLARLSADQRRSAFGKPNKTSPNGQPTMA